MSNLYTLSRYSHNMLNDLKIKQLKPRDKVYRVADHSGLCIEVRVSGAKYWRYRYRYLSKAQMLTIGPYPSITLAVARTKALEYRGQLANNQDPAAVIKTQKNEAIKSAANTFKLVAQEYMANSSSKNSKEWIQRRESYFSKDVYPQIGDKSIADVDSIDVKTILDATVARIKKTGKGTGENRAIFVRQIVSEVMRYAVMTKRATTDPTYALRGYLKQPEVNHANPLSDADKRKFMEKLNGYGGSVSTRNAIKFAAYSWLRSIEIRRGKKEYIDFDKRTWTIPTATRAEILAGNRNMKRNRTHVVPLSDQAIQIIKEQFELHPTSDFIFCGDDGNMMGKTTLNSALSNMKFSFTMHDLRATASTVMNEAGYESDWIEKQLAHEKDDKTRASYNHAQYLDQRRQMLQDWADIVDSWAS